MTDSRNPVARVRHKVGELGMVRTRLEMARMNERITELEAAVVESRRQHQRVAELTDIVTALLVPMARRDDDALEQLLRDYTDRLG